MAKLLSTTYSAPAVHLARVALQASVFSLVARPARDKSGFGKMSRGGEGARFACGGGLYYGGATL